MGHCKTMNDVFTPAQEDALKKCHQLLGEHFDRYLMTVDTSTGDDTGDASTIYWKGGYMAALGMAVNAQHKVLASRHVTNDGGNDL